MHMTVILFVPLRTYLCQHDAQAEEYEFDSWHTKRLLTSPSSSAQAKKNGVLPTLPHISLWLDALSTTYRKNNTPSAPHHSSPSSLFISFRFISNVSLKIEGKVVPLQSMKARRCSSTHSSTWLWCEWTASCPRPLHPRRKSPSYPTEQEAGHVPETVLKFCTR